MIDGIIDGFRNLPGWMQFGVLFFIFICFQSNKGSGNSGGSSSNKSNTHSTTGE